MKHIKLVQMDGKLPNLALHEADPLAPATPRPYSPTPPPGWMSSGESTRMPS